MRCKNINFNRRLADCCIFMTSIIGVVEMVEIEKAIKEIEDILTLVYLNKKARALIEDKIRDLKNKIALIRK